LNRFANGIATDGDRCTTFSCRRPSWSKKQRQDSRIVRQHDEPQTAYQRLLASGQLTDKARRQLRDQYESLDPFAPAQAVEQRLKKMLNLKVV
jgi:hypothetical protein